MEPQRVLVPCLPTLSLDLETNRQDRLYGRYLKERIRTPHFIRPPSDLKPADGEKFIQSLMGEHIWKPWRLTAPDGQFLLDESEIEKIRDELPVLADYWQIADEFNNNFWSGDTSIAAIEAQTEKDFILHGSSLFPTFKKFSNLGEFPSDDLRDCLIPIPANFKEYTADNRKKLIEETILELMDVDKMIGTLRYKPFDDTFAGYVEEPKPWEVAMRKEQNNSIDLPWQKDFQLKDWIAPKLSKLNFEDAERIYEDSSIVSFFWNIIIDLAAFAVDVSESQVLAVRYPDSDQEEFIELDPGINFLFANDDLDYSDTSIPSTPKTPSEAADSDLSSRSSFERDFSADDEMEKTQRFEKRKRKKKKIMTSRSNDSKQESLDSKKRKRVTSSSSEDDDAVIMTTLNIKTHVADIVSSSDQEDVDIVKKSEENPIKKEEKVAEIENEKETKNLVLLPLKQDKVLPSGDIPKDSAVVAEDLPAISNSLDEDESFEREVEERLQEVVEAGNATSRKRKRFTFTKKNGSQRSSDEVQTSQAVTLRKERLAAETAIENIHPKGHDEDKMSENDQSAQESPVSTFSSSEDAAAKIVRKEDISEVAIPNTLFSRHLSSSHLHDRSKLEYSFSSTAAVYNGILDDELTFMESRGRETNDVLSFKPLSEDWLRATTTFNKGKAKMSGNEKFSDENTRTTIKNTAVTTRTNPEIHPFLLSTSFASEVLPSRIIGRMPVERFPKHQMTEDRKSTEISSKVQGHHLIRKNIVHSTPISSTNSLRAKEIPPPSTGEPDLSKVMRPYQPALTSTISSRLSGSMSSMQSTVVPSVPMKSTRISITGERNSWQRLLPHQLMNSTQIHSVPIHSTPMHSVPIHSTPMHPVPTQQAPRNSVIGEIGSYHRSARPSYQSSTGEGESSKATSTFQIQTTPVSGSEPTNRLKKISKKKVFLPPLL